MIYFISAFIVLLACIVYVSFSKDYENELSFESDLFIFSNEDDN
jgi:hypothetical protein